MLRAICSRGVVEDSGLNFASYDSLLARRRLLSDFKQAPAVSVARLHELLLLEALHVLPQLEGTISRFRPDLVIYDRMCLAGRLVAEKLGIAKASFFTSYASNEH